MPEEPKVIVMYETWLLGADHMSTKDRREFIDIVINYLRTEEEPKTMSSAVMILWPTVKSQIDSNNKRKSGGAKGGRPKQKP